MRFLLVLLAALWVPLACAADVPDGSDAELIRMETAKWEPASLSNALALMAMFSSDMVSVDYGADVQGGVERRTWKEILAYGPLPEWKVKLGDWRALRPSADVVILSYKVTGITVAWKAYATSVWARREGQWKTVFYQASTAK